MDWFRVYSDGILRGSLAAEKDTVQLLWLKILSMANETRARDGFLRFAPGKPFSRQMIAETCHTTLEALNEAIEIYVHEAFSDGVPRLQALEDGTLFITHWLKYQAKTTKDVRDKEERPPLTEEQKDAMNLQRQVLKPQLTVKGATLQGNAVLDSSTGELLQDKTILSKQSHLQSP